MFVFFYRTFKFALQGFFRNIWLSIVTIIILVLTLFSVTLVYGISIVADQAINSVKDKIDVSVYLDPDASEEDILSLRYRLEELSQVKAVTYISEDEALELFKQNHAGDPIILESLSQLESNPLGVTLVVQANDIEDYPSILSLLESDTYSELVQDMSYDDNEKVIDKLTTYANRIERVGIIISSIFVVIAILIIFNTIRINIYTHREEIGIMKLVGGTNWFVRAPFLVESLLYAVFAVIITLVILYPLLNVVAPQVDIFFEGYDFDLISYVSTHLWQIISWQLGCAIVLSILSSSIAIGRYLRV
ncbi:MAG: ABC transporter permease [Patescibacteria group bacterium]